VARLTIRSDLAGKIIGLEGDSVEILAWEAEELIGQNVSVIIPFKYKESHHAGLGNYARTKEKRAMGSWLEVQAKRNDKQVINVTFCVTERNGILEAILETPSDPELPDVADMED
jgi:PAS domain S-box-containing protein